MVSPVYHVHGRGIALQRQRHCGLGGGRHAVPGSGKRRFAAQHCQRRVPWSVARWGAALGVSAGAVGALRPSDSPRHGVTRGGGALIRSGATRGGAPATTRGGGAPTLVPPHGRRHEAPGSGRTARALRWRHRYVPSTVALSPCTCARARPPARGGGADTVGCPRHVVPPGECPPSGRAASQARPAARARGTALSTRLAG